MSIARTTTAHPASIAGAPALSSRWLEELTALVAALMGPRRVIEAVEAAHLPKSGARAKDRDAAAVRIVRLTRTA
jgi:hypothetical protein